jgi:MFS family permease
MNSPPVADDLSAKQLREVPAWRLPKWRAFTAIAATYITTVFATAFAFLSLPRIADEFEVTLGAVGWVVIIESLLIAALLLPLGGLADLLGDKRVLSIGLVIFGLGTLLTGLSPTFALLICARMVMAVGNALVQSVATGLVVAIFPDHERGLAMGAQTAAVAVGAAAAPLLGGLGLEYFSWSTVFLLLLIPTFGTFLAVRVLIPNHQLRETDKNRSFDVRGSALSALAIATLVVTISNPFSLAWLSPGIVGGGLGATALLALFIRWELRTEHPLLELRLFTVRVFRTAVALRAFGFLASATTTLLLPVYLLSFRQVSAVTTGAILAMTAVGLGVGAQIAGRMYDRVGPRIPTLLGFAFQIVVSLGFAFSSDVTPLVLLGVGAGLGGLGMGLWNVPNSGAMLGATPTAFLGVGGAFTHVTRTLGSVIGQALATAIVTGVMISRGFDIPLGKLADDAGAGRAFNDGWRVAYLIAAGISGGLIMLASRLPGKPDK